MIRHTMTGLKESGWRYAIVDAVSDAHLVAIGEAAADHALITGGSGIAMGLPANFRAKGLLPDRGEAAAALPPMQGHAAVVAGRARARRSGRSAMRGTTRIRSSSTCWRRRMPRR